MGCVGGVSQSGVGDIWWWCPAVWGDLGAADTFIKSLANIVMLCNALHTTSVLLNTVLPVMVGLEETAVKREMCFYCQSVSTSPCLQSPLLSDP